MRRLAAIAAILIVAACSSNPPTQTATPTLGEPGPSPSSQVSAPAPSASATAPGSTDVPGSPTPGPAGDVPAGAQFDEATALPDSSLWGGPIAIGPDGTVVITGYRLGALRGQVPSQNAHALVGSPESGWQDVEMGGVDIANPPGHPNVRGGGAVVRSIAVGDSGYVAVGRAMFFNSNYGDATTVAAIWHSPDGLDWQFIDPRELVGADKLFQLLAVVAVPGGYVAAGSVADSTRDRISIQLIRSSDGIDWQKLTTVDGTWSLEPKALFLRGDELLLRGWELVCQDDASHISTFAWAAAEQLWRSSDMGATWQAVDLAPSGVVTQPEPAPTNKADCPSGPEQHSRFGTTGGVEGVFGDQVVASGGIGQFAVTTDLVSWRQITLPGAEAEGDQSIQARLITSTADGLQVTSLENWRTPEDDRARAGGWQTIVWQIPANGAEPVRLPSARPMVPTPGRVQLLEGTAGEIWLVQSQDPSADLPEGLTTVQRSAAGPARPWGGACTPAPNADCAFAVVAELNAPGADLHGIDLRAARIAGGDLSGADLSGALLGQASINALLDGANLSGANLFDAYITSDVAGANLSGADLTDASFNVTFFDAIRDDATIDAGISLVIERGQSLEGRDFSGQDLSGYRFGGSVDGNNMRDVDFSGADLRNVSFSAVDLTGAAFGGARLDGIYFGYQVTCPDGQLNDTSKTGAAACRL